ncbi:hypothetical protein Pla123a_24280 [Posidoniimonas polymericola]|uniref:Uncharacterized protein n=1 Tax=Posidoniimonas polymericola TaxID=2528002 RepID=A0A5C5YPW3_9BACT|nr:hypothetical protein [Posidoniimonas polymericola]TWT77002.1 hypothetical protein Pla123a_24280 [Posidoniimonas polymericola]
MQHSHRKILSGSRTNSLGRRLAFESCERRDLLSAVSVAGGESPQDWLMSASRVPVITYDQLTGDITVIGDFFDSGGATNGSKPLLTLVYDAEGAASFVLSSAAPYANAVDHRTLDTDAQDATAEFAGIDQIFGVLPAPSINPVGELADPPTGGEASAPGGAEQIAALSLRDAMAGFSDHGEGPEAGSAAHSQSLVGSTELAHPKLGPAQRLRLQQGEWDRAWAFEMTGFSAPTPRVEALQIPQPHFESAFQEFPSDAPRGLTPNRFTAGESTLASEPVAESAARSIPQRGSGPDFGLLSDESVASPQAVDRVFADSDNATDAPRTWWGAMIDRHQEIGATALAAVIARHAWLHAQPESAQRERPRRTLSRRGDPEQ